MISKVASVEQPSTTIRRFTITLLKTEFKKHLGDMEIYKFLSDIVEASQNILLIADGAITELPEIMDTYTDTWGKMVRYLEVRKFTFGTETIFSVTPDFETLQYTEATVEETEEKEPEVQPKYSEEYHLDGVSQVSKDAYARIKSITTERDPSLLFNPQKYYISIKASKNIAFIKVRTKKVRFIVMMPEADIRKCVSHYAVATLSTAVQDFYNGPCAAVDITTLDHSAEIEMLISRMIEYNKGG